MLVDLHARGVHGEHPNLDGDDPLLLQCREQAFHRAVPGPAVDPHEPVKRDAIPLRTHTPIITQNLRLRDFLVSENICLLSMRELLQ